MAIDHYLMMHKVTTISSKGAKPSIKPFVDYLRAGRPFDDSVRRWLLALLSDKGWHGSRLILQQMRGRPQTDAAFKKDLAAYEFYNDLRDTPTTRRLCEQYARAIEAEPVSSITTRSKRKGEYQVGQTTYVIPSGGKQIKLVKGRGLSIFGERASRTGHQEDSFIRKMES